MKYLVSIVACMLASASVAAEAQEIVPEDVSPDVPPSAAALAVSAPSVPPSKTVKNPERFGLLGQLVGHRFRYFDDSGAVSNIRIYARDNDTIIVKVDGTEEEMGTWGWRAKKNGLVRAHIISTGKIYYDDDKPPVKFGPNSAQILYGDLGINSAGNLVRHEKGGQGYPSSTFFAWRNTPTLSVKQAIYERDEAKRTAERNCPGRDKYGVERCAIARQAELNFARMASASSDELDALRGNAQQATLALDEVQEAERARRAERVARQNAQMSERLAVLGALQTMSQNMRPRVQTARAQPVSPPISVPPLSPIMPALPQLASGSMPRVPSTSSQQTTSNAMSPKTAAPSIASVGSSAGNQLRGCVGRASPGILLNRCAEKINITYCNRASDVISCAKQSFGSVSISAGGREGSAAKEPFLVIECRYPTSAIKPRFIGGALKHDGCRNY